MSNFKIDANSFDENGDLLIRLTINNREISVFETYYFALDKNILPGTENFEKVRLVLCQLLRNWITQIESNKNEVFLPIDFSDQYLGGFFVRKNKQELEICMALTTMFDGPNIYPSKAILDDEIETTDLQMEKEKYKTTKVEFIEMINQNVDSL